MGGGEGEIDLFGGGLCQRSKWNHQTEVRENKKDGVGVLPDKKSKRRDSTVSVERKRESRAHHWTAKKDNLETSGTSRARR